MHPLRSSAQAVVLVMTPHRIPFPVQPNRGPPILPPVCWRLMMPEGGPTQNSIGLSLPLAANLLALEDQPVARTEAAGPGALGPVLPQPCCGACSCRWA